MILGIHIEPLEQIRMNFKT